MSANLMTNINLKSVKISSWPIKWLIVATLRILIIVLTVSCDELQQQGQLYGQTSESNNHKLPGHYEFEVAPRLEPPSIKKQPYYSSSATCSGLSELLF